MGNVQRQHPSSSESIQRMDQYQAAFGDVRLLLSVPATRVATRRREVLSWTVSTGLGGRRCSRAWKRDTGMSAEPGSSTSERKRNRKGVSSPLASLLPCGACSKLVLATVLELYQALPRTDHADCNLLREH